MCINEPDTHSANTEILQTSPESTLEKPKAAPSGGASTSVTSLNGSCIAINGGIGEGATATASAATSTAAGVTKITITSDNGNGNASTSTKAPTTGSSIDGYKNSSLVSITSLNSCSDLSQGSTATLPISSNSCSGNNVSRHPLSNNNSGSDTSSNNFQERFDFEHWKGLLSDYNCFHGLYRYWTQCSGRSSSANDNGGGSDQQQSQSNHENGLGSEAGSFYTHNILGYTFGYPFGLKEDLDGSGNCNSNCNGSSNTNGLGLRKWLSGNTSSNETPLQKHYRHQQKKKMPGFRGRRVWCGCFKVGDS